jgi:hypothetical protein
LLPPTARAEAQVVAEAGIAWVHAYRRYLWRRHVLLAGALILVVGSLVQFMSQVSAPA